VAGQRDPEPALAGVPNMADVARRAGVSIATVSRALRDVPGVSEATRDRIRQVAEELSYVVSPEASALSRGQTGRVGVVVPQLGAWFYSALLASMAPVLRQAEMDLLLY
jgi:DNA-binding LacI/PurR family transcriptional regulator